ARQHYEHALAANPSSAPARKGLQGLTALTQSRQPAGQALARGTEVPAVRRQQELAHAATMQPPAQVPELVQVGYSTPAALAKPVSVPEDQAAQEDLPPPVTEAMGQAAQASSSPRD